MTRGRRPEEALRPEWPCLAAAVNSSAARGRSCCTPAPFALRLGMALLHRRREQLGRTPQVPLHALALVVQGPKGALRLGMALLPPLQL